MKFENQQSANKAFWNEIAPIHKKSYDLSLLKQGKSKLYTFEMEELGDISGLDVLHPMCHIGSDTLSLKYMGARNLVGVDFSEKSIDMANLLKSELGLDAEFLISNVYSMTEVIDREFDIVYTGKGVLCWLPDLEGWARELASFVKPGGYLYLMDIHPIMYVFDDTKTQLDIIYDYFHKDEPMKWDDDFPDYSDDSYIPKNPTYEWAWSLADIINAIINAGLQIDFIHEYGGLFYKGLPQMKLSEKEWWIIPGYEDKIPLTFTLKASKRS